MIVGSFKRIWVYRYPTSGTNENSSKTKKNEKRKILKENLMSKSECYFSFYWNANPLWKIRSIL